MDILVSFIHSPFGEGAINGALVAAAVDYHAFLGWKSFKDVVVYDWATASWRVLSGFIAGGVGATSLAWVWS